MSASKQEPSSSRPVTRKFRKALQEKEEAELEAAANYSYDKENGIAAQNRTSSPLLSLPLDVTDLLLEYVASDPKAILNLRQVCSVTKGWIDSLSVSQSRRIFSKIPIYLNLNYNDLEKFDACPPPPSTCALKLQVKVRRTITVTEHMELMKNLRTIFPSFFAFWRIQMVTLSVENYSSRLLDTLGPPKSLRELICTGDMSETHPSLLQLETIEFEKEPSSIKFFRHVVRSRNLKCLSVKIRMYRLFYEIRNSRPYDQLERLQIILDAKRNDKHFHLDIHIDPQACHEQEEDKLQLFITTFGESASSIRMFNVPNGFAGQVSKLITTTRSPIIDKYEVSKKFFNSIHSYAHKGELSEVSCLIMERHFFGNLKTLRLDIPEENQENFTRSEQLIFPSGIESIEIISEKGLLVPRNLPGSLKTLVLQRCKKSIWGSDFYTTGIELGESLSLIRRSCPFLEELRIRADISEASFGPPLTSTLEDTHGAFEKLRLLQFGVKILGSTEQKGADGGRELCDILLFDILRVYRMSLLELSLRYCGIGNKLELDSGCVERLLKSPLASSLIKLTLDCKVKEEAKESYKKLQAIVEENDQKRRR